MRPCAVLAAPCISEVLPTQAIDTLKEPFCSVSTLQGVRALEHAKAWTPNRAARFMVAMRVQFGIGGFP